MTRHQIRWFTCAAALGGAAFLSACNNSDRSAARPPAPGSTENFSSFATQTFKAGANATPINFDQVTLVYDVNDDPSAFDTLLM